MGVSQNGWFIMENPTKMEVWGYPYLRKPPYSSRCYIDEVQLILNHVKN